MIILHPDGVQHVLQDNHSNYSKDTREFALFSYLMGNGLVISNGDFWLRQRRMMQPAFHRQKINALSGMICEEAQATIDRWEKTRLNGLSFNLMGEMLDLSLEMVTRALFGARLSDPDGTIAANIAFLMEDMGYRFERPWYPPPGVPTPYNRRFTTARQYLDKIVFSLIDERRRNPDLPGDLLSMLIQATDEGAETPDGKTARMTDVQLRDEAVTLLVAGHETTASALTWTLYLLSQHPEAEARLLREVDEVLADRTPTLEDLTSMPYTRMVIDESLRLYPPGWLTFRKALADDEIGGYRIPAGTTLTLSQWATHRHPQFWQNPEVFDPERFSPERSQDRPRFAFFPFGGGPRLCIGSSFALLELQLVLPMLARRFQFELDPTRTVLTDPQVTLRPKGGMWMRLKDR